MARGKSRVDLAAAERTLAPIEKWVQGTVHIDLARHHALLLREHVGQARIQIAVARDSGIQPAELPQLLEAIDALWAEANALGVKPKLPLRGTRIPPKKAAAAASPGRPKSLGARFAASLALHLMDAVPARIRNRRDAATAALRTLEGRRQRTSKGEATRLPRQDVDSVMRLMRSIEAGRAGRIEVSPALLTAAFEVAEANYKPTLAEQCVQLVEEQLRMFPKKSRAQAIKDVAAAKNLAERTVRRANAKKPN